MQFMTGVASSILYGFRFPEAFFPGKFDVFFHSHQIFHVFCTISTLLQMQGQYGCVRARFSLAHAHTRTYIQTHTHTQVTQ